LSLINLGNWLYPDSAKEPNYSSTSSKEEGECRSKGIQGASLFPRYLSTISLLNKFV